MANRELYKTKLCALFLRGDCPRRTCTFAHGDIELRSPFRHGKTTGNRVDQRYRRDSDHGYRQRFDSRRSPQRQKDQSASFSRGRSFSPNRRGRTISHSRSPITHSERRDNLENPNVKRQRRPEMDSARIQQTEEQEEDKMVDGRHEDGENGEGHETFVFSAGMRDMEIERRTLLLEVDQLNIQKENLEDELDARNKAVAELHQRLTKLETFLQQKEADVDAVLSKLKRLLRAQQRVVRAQEDAKRMQAKLNKLVDEFTNEPEDVGRGLTGLSRKQNDSVNETSNGEQDRDAAFPITENVRDRGHDGRQQKKSGFSADFEKASPPSTDIPDPSRREGGDVEVDRRDNERLDS